MSDMRWSQRTHKFTRHLSAKLNPHARKLGRALESIILQSRFGLALAFFVLLSIPGCITSKSDSPLIIESLSSSSLHILSGASRGKLILFVHGVSGDPSLTWKNRNGILWPNMMQQDSLFKDFAIGTMGYDTSLFGRTSGIEEVATRLISKLEDEGIFQKYKEIYFIAHSMGGLVTKRILVDLNRPNQVEKLRRVKAVLYISTPAQGADIAEIGSWLSLSSQVRDMRPANFNSFLQGLENQWQNLYRDRGTQLFPRSFCAYETKSTHGVSIVSRVYAATSCDQNPYPVDADHEDIVKPVDQAADIYTWTRARIHEASILAAESSPVGPPLMSPILKNGSNITAAVRPGTDDCQISKTDNVPKVTLRTGELVILGNGDLVRLDSQMRPTTIASDGFLAEARGVAVDRNGQIFVTTLACKKRKGAVVRVDPLTGEQTPVVTIFKRPMGLAFESDGQLLVGDEIGQGGVWGRLYRVNLKDHTAEVIAEFPPPNGVHSIAVDTGSLDIYAADGVVQRIDKQNPNTPFRVEVDDLQNAQALAIRSSGEMIIGDYNSGSLFLAKHGDRQPTKIINGLLRPPFWSLAISNDEKSLFVSSGVSFGGVYQVSLPLDDKPPNLVWKSTRSGSGWIFVTLVKLEEK